MSRTLAAYEAWAATYDHAPNPTRDADREVMRALAPRFLGLDLLELGCGTGKNTGRLARFARSVVGLDISPSMLAVARHRDLPAHVDLRLISPGDPWPLAPGSSDIVTASLVLEHIQELAPVFAQAQRVLRPGGWFWVSELHPARQRRGSKAVFTGPDGKPWSPECFPHERTEYVACGQAAGLHLRETLEPGGGVLPQLLVLGFERRKGPSNAG